MSWGALNGQWVPPPLRDEVVDFIGQWVAKTGLTVGQILQWLNLAKGKYCAWKARYGKANAHNGKVPRDHWLEDWERQAIIDFHGRYPLEGYRRLSYMMLDRDVVATSPSSVYRVLRNAGLLDRAPTGSSLKGTGFVQPKAPHKHWHCDMAYLNIAGTFYYLCTVLDGYSRAVVHWEIREQMREADVETIIQKARERYPGVSPRLISDNGPQFIARDFKAYIRLVGMTHVRTSPYYPQSNGKIEAWHKTLKTTTIRPKKPTTVEEARAAVDNFVRHYNQTRLHSAIGYVTPYDMLAGRNEQIQHTRKNKLHAARQARRRPQSPPASAAC